jgi:hypothetical protein
MSTCESPTQDGDLEDELQELINEFEAFSINLICRIWDSQDKNPLACRDILRALPVDFEEEPQWLQELRIQQESVKSNERNDGKSTYREVLLIPKEEIKEEKESQMVKLSAPNKIPWKPKFVVTKTVTSTVTAINNPDMDDEDERELQWMICCEGSRDAAKSIGGMKRKAHVSKLFVKQPEIDRRMKRAATSMK